MWEGGGGGLEDDVGYEEFVYVVGDVGEEREGGGGGEEEGVV